MTPYIINPSRFAASGGDCITTQSVVLCGDLTCCDTCFHDMTGMTVTLTCYCSGK